MVKIATWNVNSIKARLPNVLDWLGSADPDIVLLQEIKCVSENFPTLAFEAAGYEVATVGQKTYNGVAILAKQMPVDILTRLPGDDADEQARYIEATIGDLRVASIYLPNGNPMGSEKFEYKLQWMDRLFRHIVRRLEREEPLILAGDYNVIPKDEDCYDPAAWAGDALFAPESRARFRCLAHLGLSDAFRALHRQSGAYTFWDYQAGAWENGHGIRIDHLMLSPQAADRLVACEIDTGPRGKPKASDHTPIWCELDP